MTLPAGHLRLDDAARYVGCSQERLARLAWDGEIPFRAMRTTVDAAVSCRDLVFAEADLVGRQLDGVIQARYEQGDRARADRVVRRMVRFGLRVEGCE